MKRKSSVESDSESDGSVVLDEESGEDEVPGEEFSDESDGEGRDPDQEYRSDLEEASVHSEDNIDISEGLVQQSERGDDAMSVASVDDESDHDSASLNSTDTVEVEIADRERKEQQEAIRSREFGQLYLPVGGIFDHALLQGLPIDEEEYKRQQQAFFNGDTVAERTTTRNTPVNVIEALDHELRFSKPPVTVDILVARYNVIKLVIKRRIDHLRSLGHSTPGIRYDYSTTTTEEADSPHQRSIRTARSSSSSSSFDRLIHDIQFRDPPITVKEMAAQYRMSVAALHAKIYALRNKGLVSGGIAASTSGRGRPRKVEDTSNQLPEQSHTEPSTSSTTFITNYTTNPTSTYTINFNSTYSNRTTIDKNARVLKYFTPEEDTRLVQAILQCVEQGMRIDWNGLDVLLSRSRGAAKQRWLKTLERKVGPQIRLSLRNRMVGLYTNAMKQVTSSGSGSGESNIKQEEASNGIHTKGDLTLAMFSVIDKMLAVRAEISSVVKCMVGAVEIHHNTFPHSAVTIFPYINTYTPTTSSVASTIHTTATTHYVPRSFKPTVTSERAARNIVPTQAVMESVPLNVTRRAFTVADDALIISTVLENRQLGIDRFWGALDAKLNRHVMAARGRWQRVLEPIVNERLASSRGDTVENADGIIDAGSTGGGSGGSIFEKYSRINDELGAELSGAESPTVVVALILAAIVGVIDSTAGSRNSTNTTNNNTSNSTTTALNHKPFTAAEDALILSVVAQWEQSGQQDWAALDTELLRPPFSALVRYKTALCTPVAPPTPPVAEAPVVKVQREYRRSGNYSPLEQLLVYNAHWTRVLNSTPLVEQQSDSAVVGTVVEHIVLTAIASASATDKRVYSAKPRTSATSSSNRSTSNNTDTIAPYTGAPTDEVPTNHRLRRFTPEEDAYVERMITEAKESGKTISWSALDKALGRSTGAVRQRWKKVLNNEY